VLYVSSDVRNETLLTLKSRADHYSSLDISGQISPADGTRELFKPSADSTNLVEIEKNFSFWVWGSQGGTSQVGVFWRFFIHLHPALGANPMGHFFGSSFFGN